MTRGEPLEFSSAITCCQILPGFDWRVCETFLTMYLGASQDQNIYPTPHLRVLLRPWKLFSATLYHCLWWDPAPTKKGSSLQTVERNRQGFHEYKQPSLLATLNATSLIPWGAPPPLLWRVSFSWGGAVGEWAMDWSYLKLLLLGVIWGSHPVNSQGAWFGSKRRKTHRTMTSQVTFWVSSPNFSNLERSYFWAFVEKVLKHY